MRKERSRGFSLLETLAAMFLLAICFGALMRATSASLALNVRSIGYTQASLWASGLMDRVFVTEFPSEGTHSGRFDDTYTWTMRISSPSDASRVVTRQPMHLYRIELTVAWTEGQRQLTSRFETLRVVSTKPALTANAIPQGQGDS